MEWRVQYREGGTDRLVRHPSPERAIQAACLLLDSGRDVFGIGTGPDSIGKAEIDRIYALWTRTKYPFGISN
jgi:hypothetical protein